MVKFIMQLRHDITENDATQTSKVI